MQERIHNITIEVDPDQSKRCPEKERMFIRDFGKALYIAYDDPNHPLNKLEDPYFTRGFDPERELGSYVRLWYFVGEEDLVAVQGELYRRIGEFERAGCVFKVSPDAKPAVEDEARQKGAERFPEQYFKFMHALGRISVELFEGSVTSKEAMDCKLHLSHNVFNLIWGQSVRVAEYPPNEQSKEWIL